jgi:hypothetical protein
MTGPWAELMNGQPLRDHLVKALDWDEAHLTLEGAVKGLPAPARGKRPRGFSHSPWELLEHIRLAQRDLLDYCTKADYAAGKWPDDYWPKSPAPPSPASWKRSLAAIAEDRRALQEFVRTTPDLFSDVPSAASRTRLRAVLLTIDHNAYHVGQLLMANRLLGR